MVFLFFYRSDLYNSIHNSYPWIECSILNLDKYICLDELDETYMEFLDDLRCIALLKALSFQK